MLGAGAGGTSPFPLLSHYISKSDPTWPLCVREEGAITKPSLQTGKELTWLGCPVGQHFWEDQLKALVLRSCPGIALSLAMGLGFLP